MDIDRDPVPGENDPSDPNAPTGQGPDDDGIGNIRPKPPEAERFPGAAENAPELETAEEVPRRP